MTGLSCTLTSSAQATAAGIPRRLLTAATASGKLIQVDRGLYALPDTWEDPLPIAQYRFSKGTFSDDTARYLHGMTDHALFALTMTFPRPYNAKAAREAGIICRTCADDALELGGAPVKTKNAMQLKSRISKKAKEAGFRRRPLCRATRCSSTNAP